MAQLMAQFGQNRDAAFLDIVLFDGILAVTCVVAITANG